MKCWDTEREWERRRRARLSQDMDSRDAWSMRWWTREKFERPDWPPWQVMGPGRMYRLAFWQASD